MMKRIIMIMILTSVSLFLISCTNYSDYKEVKIPDENLGYVKIPNNWMFEVVDEWIQITDTETDEIIGIQYYRGRYESIGETLYDERQYNPYFDEYELHGSSFISGNSNGSQWGEISFEKEDKTCEYRLIYFIGSLESSYRTEIVIMCDSIENNMLSNIAKSYRR